MLSDAQIESHYLNRWHDVNGWDYFDPPDEDVEEDDYDDYDDYLFNTRREEW